MIGLYKFQLVSADARGGGTRDEALRVSASEATCLVYDVPFLSFIRVYFVNEMTCEMNHISC